ncbi:hypothetical protein Vi05172_g7632 [Venturia inaequalis]|nr:hypothetical protein Vi05172_g7632 [Venturia inaequalis]
MNLVTNWLSNNDRPKDTIGRILASAPPGTIEITQTKKPRSLLTPWITREKELKIIFRPDDTSTPSPCPTPPIKPARQTNTRQPLLTNAPSSSTKISKRTRPARSSKKPVRPAITSAPPSYDTAIATKKEASDEGGMVQAGVMSGVGMAALYCAKMAWEMYSSGVDGEKEGDEEGEKGKKEKDEKKMLGWLGV